MWSDGMIWGLAILAALIGAGLLLRGWWWDRAKGRRRCPKCWYEIVAGASRCSECGFEAKRERQWGKTRRKKRVVALGVICALGAVPLALTSQVRREGWLSLAPTTGLILAAPWDLSPKARSVLLRELDWRMPHPTGHRKDLPHWQRRLFHDRLQAGLASDSVQVQIDCVERLGTYFSCDHHLVSALGRVRHRASRPDEAELVVACDSYLAADPDAAIGSLPRLLELADADDAALAEASIRLIASIESRHGTYASTDALLALYDDRPELRNAILGCWRVTAPPDHDVVACAWEGLLVEDGTRVDPLDTVACILRGNSPASQPLSVTPNAAARHAWWEQAANRLSDEEILRFITHGHIDAVGPALVNRHADITAALIKHRKAAGVSSVPPWLIVDVMCFGEVPEAPPVIDWGDSVYVAEFVAERRTIRDAVGPYAAHRLETAPAPMGPWVRSAILHDKLDRLSWQLRSHLFEVHQPIATQRAPAPLTIAEAVDLLGGKATSLRPFVAARLESTWDETERVYCQRILDHLDQLDADAPTQ